MSNEMDKIARVTGMTPQALEAFATLTRMYMDAVQNLAPNATTDMQMLVVMIPIDSAAPDVDTRTRMQIVSDVETPALPRLLDQISSVVKQAIDKGLISKRQGVEPDGVFVAPSAGGLPN